MGMSFLTCRLLPAATLLIAFANAQTCYYPDGKTPSNDVPCDGSAEASACCSSNSFCLAGGLCYNGGLVTRGSCTDKTWGSEACAGYCTSVDTSSRVVITPCTSGDSSNTFTCGLNTTDCQSDTNTFTLPNDMGIVLRPNQIAQLVGSSLETATPSGDTEEGFTAGALAGVAVGVAVPLLVALGIMFYLLRREQHRFSKPRLMYRLPDEIEKDDFTFSPPPARTTAAFSDRSSQTSRATGGSTLASRRGSGGTMGTLHVGAPQSFMERYEKMKKNAQIQVQSKEMLAGPISPRHELDSPTREVARFELSSNRMSS